MTQLQKELQAATEAKEQLQTEQERAKKVLEQKKAREERLSDAEVKLARTEQKEAYAAGQIQQMEAYCETIAGAVKEEAANKEEESVLCKKIKETEETAARAAEEAERLAGQDQVCEKLLDEKKNLEQKIHTLEETKKQLERTTAERTQIAAQVTQLRK